MRFFYRNHHFSMLMLALLFTAKALYLGFIVTPLWDIPDEIGHYSYARDLAEGRGLPVLGKAWIAADVMAHVRNVADTAPASNWIAQHPPVFYLLAAVPLKIGMAFTNDPEVLYRLPRLVAGISGGLLLLVLFRTMITLGLDNYRAIVLAAAVGFIPMVAHLASGTNHDITLFLFSALVVHFLVRFLLHGQLRDAYWAAVWMTLAAGNKMTAWVVIPPLLLVFALEIGGTIRHWLKHIGGVASVMLFLPLLWMLRNFYYFGHPLNTAVTDATWRLQSPLSDSFFTYINTQPVFDHFILNFYGLLGWIGTGSGNHNWFQVAGAPRGYFSILLLASVLSIVISLMIIYMQTFREKACFFVEKKPNQRLVRLLLFKPIKAGLLTIGLIAALSGAITLYTVSHPPAYPLAVTRILAVALLFFAGISAFAPLLYSYQPIDRLMLYTMIVFLFFTAILLYQVYGIYLLEGRLRATHGRYFFPVIPFMLVALAIAVQRLRIPGWLLTILVAGLVIMEMETFVQQALPFYGSAPR